MKIIIAKFSAWSYEDYKNSEHPEYHAIRNIIAQNPQSKFVLIGEGHEFKHFKQGGIEFYNINSKTGIRYFFSFFLKAELAILLRPSVIVVMGIINLIPFGLSGTISRSKLIPVLTGEIGYALQNIPHPFQLIFGALFKTTLNRSPTILTLSSGIRRELVSKYRIDSSKITVYRYRISDIFNPDVPKDLKLVLNPDGPVVLALCRISPEKGLEYLIEAAKDIVREVPNVRVVIKGSSRDQEYKRRLIELVHQYKLDSQVVFLDFSPYSEVPKFLSASDVFVLPSISEGLGLVVLEAMATGVPVVATNVGGIPDLLMDGHNGLMVNPRKPHILAEAILRLLRDAKLRKRLTDEGLRTAQKVKENEIEGLLKRLIYQDS